MRHTTFRRFEVLTKIVKFDNACKTRATRRRVPYNKSNSTTSTVQQEQLDDEYRTSGGKSTGTA